MARLTRRSTRQLTRIILIFCGMLLMLWLGSTLRPVTQKSPPPVLDAKFNKLGYDQTRHVAGHEKSGRPYTAESDLDELRELRKNSSVVENQYPGKIASPPEGRNDESVSLRQLDQTSTSPRLSSTVATSTESMATLRWKG